MDPDLKPGIFLIVDFNWPKPFEREHGNKARTLHAVVEGADWIHEAVAASGGVGGGPASLWIFHLGDYAAVDRLLRTPGDPVCDAFLSFVTEMEDVEMRVREEVVFLQEARFLPDERP